MPLTPRRTPGRFRPEALFRPRSVAVIGVESLAGAQVLGNLRAGGFEGEIMPVGPDLADLTATPDLAVLCPDTGPVEPVFEALGRRGCRAAVVLGMASGLGALAERTGVRSLGPGSFGIAIPSIGLNASRGHLPPRAGRVALVSQSAALCRAVLDWAEPNGVGFSHIVGIGGNDDLGFATVLDWLSRDPETGPILLDIRRIKDARAFMSALRAAARLRPTVAIRAGGLLADPSGAFDAAMEAALRRCGVLSVNRLEDLLSAAETLTRARPVRRESLALVTNAIGPAQLAADALLRDGLKPARLSDDTQTILKLMMPGAFAGEGARSAAGDLVYAGVDGPVRLAEAAALLAGAAEVGGVLIVHAPTGPADAAGMEAIAAAAKGMRVPLLVCAMGETTGALHRQRLGAAGVPAFASPEQAVRAFLHLVEDARNRAASRELPPSKVLHLAPDQAAVAACLTGAVAGEVSGQAGLRVVSAYGIQTACPEGAAARIRVRIDPWFGPIIGLAGPSHSEVDLPPLNLVLGQSLAERVGLPEPARVADTLVRVSQLIVDFPRIAELDIELTGACASAARLRLRGGDDPPATLAIAPYPAELSRRFQAGGETMTLRPIRPEDAQAHRALFGRLSPEDVRFRFFHALRELSAEQIARMTQVDYDREIAFVAVRTFADGRPDETVGVARLVRDQQPDEAEFAVVVDPAHKGRGLARQLMECLFDWALRQGIAVIVGQILADNRPMLAFARRLGFELRSVPGEDDVMEARLVLADRPAS